MSYYCGFCGAEGARPDYCQGCKQPGKLLVARQVEQLPPIMSTGMLECDAMFGGGLRRQCVYLLYAEPGAGKSTLISQWSHATGGAYLSTEQGAAEVERMHRKSKPKNARAVRILATKTVQEGVKLAGRRDVLYVDSISGLGDTIVDQKANVSLLVQYARELDAAVVAISHVNKSGELAGLKAVEHMVDGVIRLEGNRETRTRRLVPVKIRGVKPKSVALTREDYGFSEGYQELLSLDRHDDVVGSVLTPCLRNGAVELAEVCAARAPGKGKLLVENVSEERARRLLAVIAARYPRVAGDLKRWDWTITCDKETSDPQIEAAIVAAVLSAICAHPLPAVTLVWGAVPLVGALRGDESWDDRRDLSVRLPVGSTIVHPYEATSVESLWEHLAPAVDVEFPESPGNAGNPPGGGRDGRRQ